MSELQQEARQYRASGMTLRGIAAKLGCHWVTVARWLKDAELPNCKCGKRIGHRGNCSRVDHADIRRLASEGVPRIRIAAKLGCSQEFVRKVLNAEAQSS
jgi:DNA invertase Pin-like site-specific DNA recombinase